MSFTPACLHLLSHRLCSLSTATAQPRCVDPLDAGCSVQCAVCSVQLCLLALVQERPLIRPDPARLVLGGTRAVKALEYFWRTTVASRRIGGESR